MFNLEVQTPYRTSSLEKDESAHRLQKILAEMIEKESAFEDEADFLLWAEESLPKIHKQKNSYSEEGISVYLLVWATPEPYAECFFNAVQRMLAALGQVPKMSLQQFDFNLSGIASKKLTLIEVQCDSSKYFQIDHIFSTLELTKLLLEIKSALNRRCVVPQAKQLLVQDKITKFRKRFYSKTHEPIFEEMQGLFAMAEPKFIEQRSCDLLSRLIISQYFTRQSFLKWIAKAGETRHVVCRLLPSRLSSPFTSKKIIGLFIAVNLPHKYDVFTQEHILRALDRLGLDISPIPGGSYSFQRNGESFKCLYIEIEKKDEKPLSLKEYKQLRLDLKIELKKSIERLQPSIFMLNNEEEIVKNILFLNREISSPSDLTQAMIFFREQTDKDVSFQVILVYTGKIDLLSIEKTFDKYQAVYLPGWTQVVRYLNKKQPIQAQVFQLRITKSPDMLRSDASLNFYAARQKISELLQHVIGEFRDYNGGLILKQGEIFAQFKQQYSNHPSETLENFFYGLTPIEVQSIISIEYLSILFGLFLEATDFSLTKPQDCFIKFVQGEARTFCMVQVKDPSLADCLKASLSKFDQKSFIFLNAIIDERISLGYIFEYGNELKHNEFVQSIHEGVETWKKMLSNVKTLRLAVPYVLRYLDPRVQSYEDTKLILKMLFEGLMRINAQGKVELGVARKVKVSSDQKKYTFQLRKSYWSNGKQLLADDFVYAWKTLLSPNFKSPSAYLFFPIKNAQAVKEGRLLSDALGVTALDPKTLEIELEYPTPYFLELLAQPQFSPINAAFDRSHPTWPDQEGDGYVCNGAFLLKKNHPTEGYELVRNCSYHDASLIALDQVSIKSVPVTEIREMFIRDEIDWLGFPTGMVDLPLLPLEHGETVVLPNDSQYWCLFNTRCFPFNNSKLRQAFASAVNRASLLQKIPPGYWPAFSVLPFRYSQARLMEESLEKAVILFEEALRELGLNRESFPLLKILCLEGGMRLALIRALNQRWEEVLGVRCQIEVCNWDEFFHKVTEGIFQISGTNWISLIDDPSYTLQIFQNTSRFINFSRWHHQEYKQLLDKSSQEKKLSKRLRYYELAENVLLQDAPVVPLIRSMPSSIKTSRIEMPTYSALKSWDFKWASIRKNQNKE